MKRREVLKALGVGTLALPLTTMAQSDNTGETPNVVLPSPRDFASSDELVLQTPLEPLSVGKPPAEWDGNQSPKVGEGPAGIAKEFGPSGPIVDGRQVSEYLDDDDTHPEASARLAGLVDEFGGASNPRTEYYELGISVGTKKIRADCETRFLGYGPRVDDRTEAQWPAPLFIGRLGSPMVIRFINEIDDYMSVHLHGAHGPAHSDGHPAFVIPRPTEADKAASRGYGQNHRDYFYPHTVPAETAPRTASIDRDPKSDSIVRRGPLDFTESPSTMWYHDHSMDITGPHVMLGLAGFMPVFDEWELDLLHDGILPFVPRRGTAYEKDGKRDYDGLFRDVRRNPLDVPLVLQDRRFSLDGQLLYTVKGHNGFLGSHVLVNGQLRPRMTVPALKHRFRILNGSNARFYKLALYADFVDPEAADSGDDEKARFSSLEDLIPLRQEMPGRAWFRIAKDTWLYPEALRQDKILIGMANRAEVVIDFKAIAAHFKKRCSDPKFAARAAGKRLVVYLANVLDQDSGRGPRGKLGDGNDQELPPVEPIQNVNVPSDREDFAQGELRLPWLTMRFDVVDELSKLPAGRAADLYKTLGYTKLEDVRDARVQVGTPLRPHRVITPDEIVRTREVVFERGNGIWQINGKVVDEFLSNFVPELDTAEAWILENGGGGWWHPIHIHLESHQQVEYLAEPSIAEVRRLLAEVVVRFEQAIRDERDVGRADKATQLGGLLTVLKDSLAAMVHELTPGPAGIVEPAVAELRTVADDETSLQRLTRAALKELAEFAHARDRELDEKARPADQGPLAAYLRLKSLYGDIPGMVADLNAEAVIEGGRVWTRIRIPPWDRFKSDTTILGPNTRVKIYMKFRTFDGPFVFHCHNLEHEDMRMMFTFDPRPTPPDIACKGPDHVRRFHDSEQIVTYRHPFRFSGDAASPFDLKPHLDSGPPNAKKEPPWHEVPRHDLQFPRAHPIWGGWDQDI